MNNLKHFLEETSSQKSAALNYGFLAYLPYMLIATLPLFALYLKLLYLGFNRRYGEHLVFALHVNAFAFLLASAMVMMPGNVGWLAACVYNNIFPLISISDYLQIIPFVWLISYLPVAMQRVYGGHRAATGLRWLVLISAHLFTILTLTIVAELIGIVTHG
jgi:hypothetical protein